MSGFTCSVNSYDCPLVNVPESAAVMDSWEIQDVQLNSGEDTVMVLLRGLNVFTIVTLSRIHIF